MCKRLRLTRKRAIVLELLLQGASNAEIAKEMGIAERTVKAYMKSLFAAFDIGPGGVKRVRLAVKAYRLFEGIE